MSVFVPGDPAGLTASSTIAEPWKRAVAQRVQEDWFGGYLREPCRVELRLCVRRARDRTTAVSNLLKATLDGLAHVIFCPCSAGGQPGPWNREDFWITQLVAEKAAAASETGVFIRVGGPIPDHLSSAGDPFVQTFVRGSPPLLPGDRTGQQKVVAWRYQLQQQISALKHEPPTGPFSLSLSFHIESSRMLSSDLDNFCVPAAQAASLAMTGSFHSSAKLRRLAAEKTEAKNSLGTQVNYHHCGEQADVQTRISQA